MIKAEAHIGVGRQVKNKIASGHRANQRRQVQAVTLQKPEFRIGQRRLQEFPLASGKIVPADNPFAVGKQPVHEIAADEAGRAGHNEGHDRSAVTKFTRG